VIAKVEWHPGELYPRVGFIVTNMSRQAWDVRAMDQRRQGWTRLSCRTSAANAVRLQLHALAYNLGNFLRTLATPEPIKDWSLDQPEGEADQDRREGRQPRPLRRTAVRGANGGGSRPRRQSVLRERGKSATIHAGAGHPSTKRRGPTKKKPRTSRDRGPHTVGRKFAQLNTKE
jgi:Transposase DDE domain group 1